RRAENPPARRGPAQGARLQDLALESSVLRPCFLASQKVRPLTGERTADATLLPGALPLLPASVREVTTTAHDHLPGLLLHSCGLPLVVVGGAHSGCVQLSFCCPLADTTASQRALHPLAQAKSLAGPVL